MILFNVVSLAVGEFLCSNRPCICIWECWLVGCFGRMVKGRIIGVKVTVEGFSTAYYLEMVMRGWVNIAMGE